MLFSLTCRWSDLIHQSRSLACRLPGHKQHSPTRGVAAVALWISVGSPHHHHKLAAGVHDSRQSAAETGEAASPESRLCPASSALLPAFTTCSFLMRPWWSFWPVIPALWLEPCNEVHPPSLCFTFLRPRSTLPPPPWCALPQPSGLISLPPLLPLWSNRSNVPPPPVVTGRGCRLLPGGSL